jgi:FAD/FMN-containing dehydrogenase
VRLSVAVQHHPSREHLLPALVAALGPGTEVVSDPDPLGPRSALRTYRLALAGTPPEATHRLVVQDDAQPAADWRARAEAAIAERPEELIAFFVPGAGRQRDAMLSAEHRGEAWARLARDGQWTPTVALCWPVAEAADFLAWSEETFPGPQESDDSIVGAWVRKRKRWVWATVPSCIEHPNTEPSLFGKPSKGSANRGRVAATFR